MTRTSLKSRLLKYIRNHYPDFISGGELERLTAQETNKKPSNASRRLRELQNEGMVEKKNVDGTVYYKAAPPKKIETIKVIGLEEGVKQHTIWR